MLDDRSATPIGGLVLAAGEARRFGSPKQLAPLAGRPLLEHALIAMSAVARLRPTVVVVGAHADEVLARVPLYGVRPVRCEGWAEGQAASLRCGVAALAEEVEAVVVVLGDQPAIDPRAIERVIESRDGTSAAVRASYGGRPGHPVLLERALFAAVAGLRGDEGARTVLADAIVRVVPCDGLGSDLDVDEPGQLDAARVSGAGSDRRR
ncbi:MAG: nucleotidyltransferase family protein [Solirubrobacteraceae bacterium]